MATGRGAGGGAGHRSFRPRPRVSWMELDEGLYADVCFAKVKPLLVRPLKKTSSQREQSLPHFTGSTGWLSLKVSRTRGASRKLHYGLGLPGGPLPESEDLGAARKTACVANAPGHSAPLGPAEGPPMRGLGSSGLFRPQWLRWAEPRDDL